MIRYPDGSLRNLTQEAGYGSAGLSGTNAIAVREPSVHWNGTKALFSMVVDGAGSSNWQLYEVSGLAKGEVVKITKVANQPAGYNNISPLYAASDERGVFRSTNGRKVWQRVLRPTTSMGAVDVVINATDSLIVIRRVVEIGRAHV